ncbi:MAG: DUF3494 domain-containing protein [Acidipila sp.]|nr:DUF3494 domain-containing protein [Acidipila sp.]
MRKFKLSSAWFLIIVLGVFAAGCGREQTGFTAPFIVATNPVNGAIGVPVNATINATFNVPINPVSISTVNFTVTPAGGAAIPGTVTFAGMTATFTPAANLLPSTVYTAAIGGGVTDPAGNALVAGLVPNPWTFTTGTIPFVTSVVPANGATAVPLNQKVSVFFSEPMNPATLNATTITLTGPAMTPVAGMVTPSANGTAATFMPAVNLLPNTVYTFTVTTGATSAAGNSLAANFVSMFTTGAAPSVIPPTIIATNPANLATNVPTNQQITATFSTAMDPTTVNGTTFTVTGPGATPVAGAVTLVGNIALFTPAAALAPSTLFTATIASGVNGVKSLTGIALAAGPVPNPWTFTTGTTPNVTPPTITITSPANAATGVQLNAAVSATFSAPMDPTTINATTFTLTGPGITPVAGMVTYVAGTSTATFTPNAPLVMNTVYTANVSTGAKDVSGNALAAGPVSNPWSFTTGPPFIGGGPGPINLGTAAAYGIFGGGAGMTNQGILTQINNGGIGTTAVSTAVTGFHDTSLPGNACTYTETPLNMGVVNGVINTAPPPPTVACPNEGTAATLAAATQALIDATNAYNAMAALPPGPFAGAGQLGGLTLTPGVYTGVSFMITGSDLTLDAQGNPNAVWVFQIASTLTVGAPGFPRNVILINGAQPQNVYWQVGSAATINPGGGGTMVGTIIANSGVVISTAGAGTVTTLNGRALSLISSVTVVNTVINVP